MDVLEQNIIGYYVHGSEDSTDRDICYILDHIPSFQEAKEFCANGNEEDNRNVIHIDSKNGIVDWVFKGSTDEVNNALLQTYGLHEQQYPLLITNTIERNMPKKLIRAVRIILSQLSRCQYRTDIKKSLRGTWSERLYQLSTLKMTDIDWTLVERGSKIGALNARKIIAFQIGQVIGLINKNEYYTKSAIAKEFPLLSMALYRKDDTEALINLEKMFDIFTTLIHDIKYEETEEGRFVRFPSFNDNWYNIKTEEEVEN